MSDEARKQAMLLLNDDPVRLPAHLIPQQTVKGTAGGALVGAGAASILMMLVQGHPEVISAMVNWGPALAVLGLFVWVAQKFGPPMLAAQQAQSEAGRLMAGEMGKLTAAIRETLDRDQDVRMAVSTLAGEMRDLSREVRQHLAEVKGMAGTKGEA